MLKSYNRSTSTSDGTHLEVHLVEEEAERGLRVLRSSEIGRLQ